MSSHAVPRPPTPSRVVLSIPKRGVPSSEHTAHTLLDEPTDNRSTNPTKADVPVLRDYRVRPTRFGVAVPAESEAQEGGIEGDNSE